MSAKLLDTSVVIDLVPGLSGPIHQRFRQAYQDGERLVLSTVSVFEFGFGAERSQRRNAQLEALRRLLISVEIADFSEADANMTALVKADLSARGQMIGAYDLMIAGQALAHDWTVVTSNTREFARVSGLALEDWRTPA